MARKFDPKVPEWLETRAKAGAPTAIRLEREMTRVNDRVALILVAVVGSMWCAYFFAGLALVALPSAMGGGILPLIQWLSQTFIQLVMLSVIMVGQNIQGRAADKRAEATYEDATAILAYAEQILQHVEQQDEALSTVQEKTLKIETSMGAVLDKTLSMETNLAAVLDRTLRIEAGLAKA